MSNVKDITSDALILLAGACAVGFSSTFFVESQYDTNSKDVVGIGITCMIIAIVCSLAIGLIARFKGPIGDYKDWKQWVPILVGTILGFFVFALGMLGCIAGVETTNSEPIRRTLHDLSITTLVLSTVPLAVFVGYLIFFKWKKREVRYTETGTDVTAKQTL